MGPDPLFSANSKMLAELSLRYSVPTIYEYQAFAEAGGLMSYGGSNKESYRWAGVYTGRILKGAKPADLPVRRQRSGWPITGCRDGRGYAGAFPWGGPAGETANLVPLAGSTRGVVSLVSDARLPRDQADDTHDDRRVPRAAGELLPVRPLLSGAV
jgi:hypothetical protein